MKKGLYIIYEELDRSSGVNRKIKSQIDTFREAGFEMDIMLMKPRVVPAYKILYRLPFTNLSPEWKWDERFRTCDFIYFRRPFFMNMYLIRLLRRIKKENPSVKIIMEIPTYPYDREILKKRLNISIYLKEISARGRVKRYIDRIAILGDEEAVFHLPTIKISNGYDFRGTRERSWKREDRTINMALTALFDTWHGYERILYGLADYKRNGGKRDIMLHFVGDGPEKTTYENIAKMLGLDQSVTFYGMIPDRAMIEIYDRCDIGICSLGAYKKDIWFSCELKSREYLSVGLPIVTGVKLDVMDDGFLRPYILEFPNDDSNIDMNEVIKFYDSIYGGREDVSEMICKIRQYAVLRFDQKKAIENVIRFIEEQLE